MPRINEELVRKRAEHNDGVIHSLEEVSLHQFEIEKIEFLNQHCRRLKIIYLQNNVISKIENLNRLHDLDYLNLALNSITKIENLDSCENLRKLDLTVNFIDLENLESSLDHLKLCPALRELYLMGNPCAQLDGFRDLVIAWLPNLHNLDGQEISHSERIQARHRLHDLKLQLRDAIEEQRMVRNSTLNEPTTDASYTPENRLKMYRQMADDREKKEADKKKSKSQPLVEIEDPFREAQKRMSEKAVEAPDGTLPKQRNQGQWEFSFEEDEKGNIIVDIGVEKYLATSLMDVDVHPLWFQVKIKDRLILLHLPEEVRPDSVRVQRIQANGHLVLILPKVNPIVSRKSLAKSAPEVQPTHTSSQSTLNSVLESTNRMSRVTPVVPVADHKVSVNTTAPLTSTVYTQPEEPWEDNADVPPLE